VSGEHRRLDRLREQARAHVAATEFRLLRRDVEREPDGSRLRIGDLKQFLARGPGPKQPARVRLRPIEQRQFDAADALERSRALRALVSCLPEEHQESAAEELLAGLVTHYSRLGSEPSWLQRLLEAGPFL
jgi:hypothetical protein